MARDAEFRARITAKDDASKVIDKVADAADDLEKPVEVEVDADVSNVLSAFDQVATEAKATAEAAEVLGRALGPDLAAQADTTRIVGELQQMGLTLDQIKGNADELGAKMRELSDADVGGKLGGALGTTRGKLDEVSDSARGANSALANMIGNTTQDLGAMSGVAGSAGVAIGQMGEYIADAALGGENLNSVLKSFAAVAAPIAAVTVAMSAIGSIFKAAGDRAARASEQVDVFTDSLGSVDDATDAVKGLSGQLQAFDADARTMWGGFVEGVAGAARAIPLLGGAIGDAGQNIANIIPTLNKLGISAEDIGEAAAKGGSAWDNLQVSLDAAREAGQITADQYAAASQALYGFRDSAEEAAVVNKFLGTETEDAAEKTEELTKAAEDAADAIREQLVAVLDASGALEGLAGSLDDIRADAIDGVFAEFGKPEADAGKIRDIAGAVAELPQTFKDLKGVNIGDVLAGSFKADSFLDAIDSLGGQMRERMSAQFAAGDPQGAEDIAETMIRDIVSAMGGKLTGEQVSTLLGLDDLEAQIAVAVEQSAVESARRQLDILTGVGGATPYTASIALALDAGTITGEQAQTLIQAQLGEAGVKIPSELATPATAEAVAGATAALAAGKPAVVPVDADTKKADKEVQGVKTKAEATKPVVPIDSNTTNAVGTMMGLLILAAFVKPTVYIQGDATHAVATLNALQHLRPQVPVNAFLSDYPTASEISRSIGTVRVPVVAETTRLTGSYPS